MFLEKRKKLGISQQKLAKDLGISRTLISFWENGKHSPSKKRTNQLNSYFKNSKKPKLTNINPFLKHRTELGISQNKLAKDLGVSRTLVSFWENDMVHPGKKRLSQLSSYFKLSNQALNRKYENWLNSSKSKVSLASHT